MDDFFESRGTPLTSPNRNSRFAESQSSREDAVARLDGLAILVVDDHADIRDNVQLSLRRHGAQVRAAASAHEARALLQRFQADVIITDLRMPREGGLAFVKSVRRTHPARPEIIALTGFASPSDVSRALEAGVAEVIPKPAHPEVLCAAIERVLKRPAAAPATTGAPPTAAPGDGDSLLIWEDGGGPPSVFSRPEDDDLPWLTFHRAGPSTILVENDTGRVLAAFERFTLHDEERWRIRMVPEGLSPSDAKLVFARWCAAGRYCHSE